MRFLRLTLHFGTISEVLLKSYDTTFIKVHLMKNFDSFQPCSDLLHSKIEPVKCLRVLSWLFSLDQFRKNWWHRHSLGYLIHS